MKKTLFIVLAVIFFTSLLHANVVDFCDSTVVVVLDPGFSEYSGSRDAGFWGSFEKLSVENIFQIHNESAIATLGSRGIEFRGVNKV